MQTALHNPHLTAEELRLLYLFVRVDVDVALDALLSHVGPGVAAHPLSLTLGALVFSEASLLPLVGREPLPFGSGLKGTRALGVTLPVRLPNTHITFA